MGNILMTGSGGGGAGSDDCTGTAAELLKGYTGILKGSDDEPVPGTLELTGNAQVAHVMNGETFYTNNAKIKHSGTMPNRGDYNGWGNSKGNDAGNQRMWVKIPQGYYNENANVFLSWADIRAMAGITAEKIKKNEPIMGIIGSFEGYIPNPNDLYLRGKSNISFTDVTDYVDSWIRFDSGQITFYGIAKGPILKFSTNFAGFNTFNIELNATDANQSLSKISLTKNKRLDIIASKSNVGRGSQIISLDIRAAQMNGTFYLILDDLVGVIYRIWLA